MTKKQQTVLLRTSLFVVVFFALLVIINNIFFNYSYCINDWPATQSDPHCDTMYGGNIWENGVLYLFFIIEILTITIGIRYFFKYRK